MKFRACIFDLDGVIVNTAEHHFVAWKQLAEELGVPFSETDNEKLKGVSRVESLEYILRKGGLVLDPATKLQLMDRKNAHYLSLARQTKPSDALPGVLDLLHDLRSAGVGIALGSSSKNAELILDRLDIGSFFDVIVDGNRITLSKPDPEVFLMGAKQLNLDPAHCLVFEDAQSGIDAARAGGFPVIGIGNSDDLEGADLIISGFKGLRWMELVNLLDLKK